MTTTSPLDLAATTPTRRSPGLLATGAVAALGGGLAAVAAALAGEAAGVPMEVAASATDPARGIPLAAYLLVTVGWTAVGVVVAFAARRWAPRPATTWAALAVVATVASFVMPATADGATTATRLVLDLTHVAAAIVAIPLVTSRLPRRRVR